MGFILTLPLWPTNPYPEQMANANSEARWLILYAIATTGSSLLRMPNFIWMANEYLFPNSQTLLQPVENLSHQHNFQKMSACSLEPTFNKDLPVNKTASKLEPISSTFTAFSLAFWDKHYQPNIVSHAYEYSQLLSFSNTVLYLPICKCHCFQI